MRDHRYVVAAPISRYDMGLAVAVQIDNGQAAWLTARNESLLREQSPAKPGVRGKPGKPRVYHRNLAGSGI